MTAPLAEAAAVDRVVIGGLCEKMEASSGGKRDTGDDVDDVDDEGNDSDEIGEGEMGEEESPVDEMSSSDGDD